MSARASMRAGRACLRARPPPPPASAAAPPAPATCRAPPPARRPWREAATAAGRAPARARPRARRRGRRRRAARLPLPAARAAGGPRSTRAQAALGPRRPSGGARLAAGVEQDRVQDLAALAAAAEPPRVRARQAAEVQGAAQRAVHAACTPSGSVSRRPPPRLCKRAGGAATRPPAPSGTRASARKAPGSQAAHTLRAASALLAARLASSWAATTSSLAEPGARPRSAGRGALQPARRAASPRRTPGCAAGGGARGASSSTSAATCAGAEQRSSAAVAALPAAHRLRSTSSRPSSCAAAALAGPRDSCHRTRAGASSSPRWAGAPAPSRHALPRASRATQARRCSAWPCGQGGPPLLGGAFDRIPSLTCGHVPCTVRPHNAGSLDARPAAHSAPALRRRRSVSARAYALPGSRARPDQPDVRALLLPRAVQCCSAPGLR